MYGFMLLVFVILAIVTVCVTIVGTYFLLNAENYHWQWTSFCAAASTALCAPGPLCMPPGNPPACLPALYPYLRASGAQCMPSGLPMLSPLPQLHGPPGQPLRKDESTIVRWY